MKKKQKKEECDACKILTAVAECVKKLPYEEDYINYVLFSFTGVALKHYFGDKIVKGIFETEILNHQCLETPKPKKKTTRKKKVK